LKGADYIAVRRLTLREDGDKPGKDRWSVLAEAGETCERIPQQFLADCIACGDIRPASEGTAPTADNVREANARRKRATAPTEVKE
jgi:hypothetical protein